MLYCGSIMFGRCVGTTGPFAKRNLTIQDVFEAIGAYNAGKISLEQFKDVEDHACPGAGACGGQFTANTMATAYEMLGISPDGLERRPRRRSPQGRDRLRVRQAGDGACVKKGITPRSIVTRKSFENAIAGRDGHGRLHQRGAAPARRRPRTSASSSRIDDFDRISTQDAGAGRPQAVGHLHRARDVRGGRHGGGGQAAARGGAASRGREDGDGPHDRRGGQARRPSRAGQKVIKPLAAGASSRRGASPSCAAIWRPAAA